MSPTPSRPDSPRSSPAWSRRSPTSPTSGSSPGGFGLLAAIGATAIGARLRTVEDEPHEIVGERDGLRRELDALAAIFAEEASTSRAHDILPLAQPQTEAIVDTVSGLLGSSTTR